MRRVALDASRGMLFSVLDIARLPAGTAAKAGMARSDLPHGRSPDSGGHGSSHPVWPVRLELEKNRMEALRTRARDCV